MKISVVAVGRLKEKYFADAQAEYLKRISAYAEGRVQEVAPAPPSKSSAEQSAIETAALLSKAGGLVVALDKSGRNMTSEELASFIASKCADCFGKIHIAGIQRFAENRAVQVHLL